MPTLRSSASRNGSKALGAVRSNRPIRLGVLNTAGIPSVAKSIACFCSTMNCSSPRVPILGEDFTEAISDDLFFPPRQLLLNFVRPGRTDEIPFCHCPLQVENTERVAAKMFVHCLQ